MLAHSRIDDRYEIKELLGEGGMGIVYKAFDSQRKGYVALKTMKDAADPAALELFAQEWRTLASISHPNIVDVFNSGELEEHGQRKPYFVMPLLPGRTLDKLIRDASHRLTAERVVDILIQTCRGLQAAHDHGLIHRDLKPSNLFVMNDDSVKIIDFGMVHLVDVRKTATGIKGTLQYMAPEQLEMKDVTAATDIFSLGVVSYEALTGRKPFDRGTETATAQAIRNEFPPPASDLNPTVNKVLSQVVAKAMAKGPWNRFGSAREFGEHLQKALKGEPIELFDASRIQPRVERVRRALREGDLEFANEILNELQLEGRVDSEITLLLEEVKQATRGKVVRQLLDSARMRLQEEEFPLAWQKVQEALQRDPGNTEAQALQAEIETRRSDQQSDKWRRLVHQHLHNHSFAQARQAIEEIRKIKRDDLEVAELIAEADLREKQFRKACDEKEQQYQSAMRAYGSGEISTALSKLEKILDLDGRTPGFITPGRDEVYRETYNRIRTEWEGVQHAIAEIEKVVATGNLARAAEMSEEQSEKYPNDFGLRALKLKVEDLLRQEKSAYIAEIGRRVDAEPNLDRAVKLLEEALARYPKEQHFQELASSLRKRRDLVDSISLKARQYEEHNLIGEALGQWATLRSIYPQYPGLEFEVQRVQLRVEQQEREEAKLKWVEQIDRVLQTSDFERAQALALEALAEFPGDQELQSLKQLAIEGRERSSEGLKLMEQAQGLRADRQLVEAIELLRRATNLDPHSASIRDALADALAEQAQVLLPRDWRAAEPLIQEALRIAPAHALAKSLRPSVLLAKRMEFVDLCVAQARELQAAGDLSGAFAKVLEGLASYPNDSRLVQLQNTLRSTMAEQGNLRRRRDLEELNQISREAATARDQTSLTALLDRTVVLAKPYPEDAEFSTAVSAIQERLKTDRPGLAAEMPVTKEIAPAPSLEPVQVKVASVNQWKLFADRLWQRVKSDVSSLGLKAALLAGWVKTHTGRLSWVQRAAAAVILLIIIALVSTISRKQNPKPLPVRPVAITFHSNVEGALIQVDGQPVTGDTANLRPGAYSATATKLGYKPAAQLPFNVGGKPATVELALVPEPHVIRVSADNMPEAKVLLDDAEIGPLLEGNFSYDLPGSGEHTLKLVAGKGDVFSIKFQADAGAPASLSEPPTVHDLPVVVVSALGPRATVRSSLPDMRAGLKNGELQVIPAGGLELPLTPSDNEIEFDDGKKQRSLLLESGNAPVLVVMAGATNKGYLVVEANMDGASVYINGVKKPRPVLRGKWQGQLDPGEYTVHLTLNGYDNPADQKLTVVAGKNASAKFTLAQAVTLAFLRIEGGTPEADVFVDGNPIGKLDPTGALAPTGVTPDVDHVIRIEKENYEPFETKRHAPVKEAIRISAPEAQLKQFGALVFEGQPPNAKITIRRRGEAPRDVTEKAVPLRGGAYTVDATADGYEPFQQDEQVGSGQSVTVQIAMNRKAPTPTVTRPKPVDVPDLFDESARWTRQEDGFWIHDGPVWFKELYFTHVFEVLKPKKGFIKQAKVRWVVYAQDDHYIECELDDTTFSTRERIGGKWNPQIKHAHKTGSEGFVRVEITVASDHVIQKVGQAIDRFNGKVGGRTGFDGKFGLRLVK
jgi:eukaryotic-like serine/threonine-protein kinase